MAGFVGADSVNGVFSFKMKLGFDRTRIGRESRQEFLIMWREILGIADIPHEA